jgi:Tol biopolymer transport system component
MGEVYRARDTRLERTVAIKILPRELSNDPIRKQRFDREAKTISNLNHPHICVLHDVGSQDGIDYLVMECVEGETLSKRLEKGSLPLDQVLKVGREIADALDKAHRSGIVHRDLKPGNIVLTPTGAKLLDFGLAKPAAPLASLATLTGAVTQSSPMTEQGAIVGTFQYMSPEQVEGKEVDCRSDIFSLGAVLYEMVTGKRAFEGKSQLSVASAILEKEPEPLGLAKPITPPALDHAVKKCLAKVPDERWQSASDLASELKWISETGSQAGAAGRVPAGRRSWERAGWLLAAAFFLTILAGGTAWWVRARQVPPAMHFNIPMPFPANDVALSPDGRTLALVAYSNPTNKFVIWTHEVGSRTQTPLQGTEGASRPFWSPDGRSIAFFAGGKLKKIDVSGGSAQLLCDAPHGRGGAWSQDGVILFSPEGSGGLYRVSSAGGTPVEVTKTLSSEFSHRWPVFLRDGRHFLYLAANFSGQFERNEIVLGSLDSDERRSIVRASSNVAYAEPGYLLYMRENSLVAQAFDPRAYVVRGEPRPISDEVQYTQLIDLALFDVAGKRILVTQTGRGAARSQLNWFDRNGKLAGAVGIPARFGNVNLAPDGKSVAVDEIDRDGRHVNIWIHSLKDQTARRLTFSLAADQLPVWSPDGKRVIFGSNQKFHFTLYQKNSDGSGSQDEIVDLGVPQQGIWDWSRDGKYILLVKNTELIYMSMTDKQAKPFLQTKASVRNAQFSPDGRWVAYSSNESGTWEVYVSPFPSANSKWQVSAGGEEPRWKRDGKELFYLSAEGKMMAVPLKTGDSFEAGPAVALFQTHTRQPVSLWDAFSYDVSADGQRFLINTKVDDPNPAPLSIVLNWASEMEK